MSWWPGRSTADRVLAGALVTRRHFLKGAAILGVAVAVVPRVLVQVPESYVVEPDFSNITELSALLKRVYGPSMEQQQMLAARLYMRFDAENLRSGLYSARLMWP